MTPRAFRKHGPEVVKAVGDLWDKGLTDSKIGEALGLNRKQVNAIRHRHKFVMTTKSELAGVIAQNGGDPKMGKGPKPSGVPARLAHIVKVAGEYPITSRYIMDKYSVTSQTAMRYIHKLRERGKIQEVDPPTKEVEVSSGPKFKYFAAVEIEEDICNGEAKKMHPRAIYYAKKAREADRRGRPTDAASYRRLVDRHRHGASA